MVKIVDRGQFPQISGLPGAVVSHGYRRFPKGWGRFWLVADRVRARLPDAAWDTRGNGYRGVPAGVGRDAAGKSEVHPHTDRQYRPADGTADCEQQTEKAGQDRPAAAGFGASPAVGVVGPVQAPRAGQANDAPRHRTRRLYTAVMRRAYGQLWRMSEVISGTRSV